MSVATGSPGRRRLTRHLTAALTIAFVFVVVLIRASAGNSTAGPGQQSPTDHDPDTAIQSLVCKYHPIGGTTCSDVDGNGGETTTLSYSISHADGAEYLVHYDGSADSWEPLSASPADVWFDSFPTCDPQPIQVRAVRSSDGAVDPTPATTTIVVIPYGGCPPPPPPPPPPPTAPTASASATGCLCRQQL